MNWPFKRKSEPLTALPKRPVKVEPIIVRRAFSVEDWNKDVGLANEFSEWLDEEIGRRAAAVLYSAIPSGFPARGQIVNEATAALECGRVQGYMDCLNLFLALANPRPTYPEIEQTYGTENLEPE